MNSLLLKSSNSDVTVVFSDVDGDYFRVAVSAHDHSAARSVYAYTDAHGIARLFAEAARDWRDWNVVKSWESVLGIRIRSNPGRPDEWELKADLGLDAGQLETIAREAEGVFSGAG